MLRTNLSTQPFYNERAVRTGLAVVAAVAIALTAFNLVEVWSLRARDAEFRARDSQNATQAQRLREQAQALRQTLNPAQLGTAQAAAREANLLIERRAFSWTDLFNQFERTLPSSVRVSAVQPQVDPGGSKVVSITVVARTMEDLDAFIDALEQTGSFRNLLAREEVTDADGLIRAVLQGAYGAPAATQATAGGASRP